MGAVPAAFLLVHESSSPNPPRPWSVRIAAARQLRARAANVEQVERWCRRFLPLPRAFELAEVRSRDARAFLGMLVAAWKRGHVAVEGSAEEIGRRILRSSGRNVRRIRARLVERGLVVCVHQLDAAHAGEGRRQGYAPNTYALGPIGRRILGAAMGGRRGPLRTIGPINRSSASSAPDYDSRREQKRGSDVPLRGTIEGARMRAPTLTAVGADEPRSRSPELGWAGGADQGASGVARPGPARLHQLAQEPPIPRGEGEHSPFCLEALTGLCTCRGSA